jgi:hypothetical protein
MKIKIPIIIVLLLLISFFSGCTEEDWLWGAEHLDSDDEEENTTPEGYYESCYVSVYTSVTVTSYKWNDSTQSFDYDSVDDCEVELFVVKSDGYSERHTVLTGEHGQVWDAYLTGMTLYENESIHVEAYCTVGETLLSDYKEITFEDASDFGRIDRRDWRASFKFSGEISNIE